MKKNILVIASILFAANCLLPVANCFSQGTWPWAVQANQGPVGAYNESWGLDIATDATGNMYVAGRFYSDTVYFGSIALVNGSPSTAVQPSSDIYIVKYDPSGNVIWAKRAGGTGNPYNNNNSYPRSIAVDASGNIYITGAYACATITLGSVTLINSNTINYSANPWDYFVAKYDALGNVVWARGAAAGNGGEEGMGVVADASGNVYVTGTITQIAPSNTVTFGSITLTQTGASNLFLVKYDASGNVLWATNPCYASPEPSGIAIDPSGNNIYIVGTFWSSINFGATTLTVAVGVNNEGFLVKYNSSGNVVWARQSVGSWKQQITGVAVDPSGNNVYIVGKFHQSNVITFGSITLPQQGFWDGCIVKYDAASGNALCGQGIGGSVGDQWYSNDVSVHPSGDVYVTGRAFDSSPLTIGTVTMQPTGGADPMYILVFDPNCNAICGDVLASGGNWWNRVATGSSGNVYVGGSFIGTMLVGTTTLVSAGTSVSWARLTMFAAKYVSCVTSALAVSATHINPLCFSQCTGTATANPTGGTSPYTYSWNTIPVQTAQTATGLCAGIYIVTVTDAVGAIATYYVTITQPTAVSASHTQTSPLCNGDSTGTATATATGGTSPYTYLWSSGQTTPAVSALAAGTYAVTVTDANGCTAIDTVIINQPAVLSSSHTQINPLCNGAVTGTATVTAAGGTSPYIFLWSSGQTTSAASGLGAGTYTIIIADVNGCLTIDTVTITEPSQILITTGSTLTTCDVNTGTASANPSGGTPGYTYLWSDGQTTSTATGLGAGIYTVTVTDTNGCNMTATITVSAANAPSANIVSSVNPLCNSDTTGTATVTATGGTSPYSYLWSNGQTTDTATGLGAGIYTVIVTDSAGCTGIDTVTITEPSAISIASGSTQTNCNANTGTATANPSNGTPGYSYLWSNGQTTSTATGLAAGTYTVTVTDANGCTQTATAMVTMASGPTADAGIDVTITLGSSVTLTATGGGTYLWNTGATTSAITVSPNATTEYCVTVTDLNGCSDSACVRVFVEIPCPTNDDLTVPNAFSPNADGQNDDFCLQGWNTCIKSFIVYIYDRWGEQVFQSADPDFCWDGTYKGKPMDAAVFVYYIRAELTNDDSIIRKGNISLVR